MKKLIVTAISMGCLMASCGDKDPVNTSTQTYSTYNYITRINDDGDPIISKGAYHFNFDFVNMKVQVSTDMVDLGDNEDSPSFVTKEFTFQSLNLKFDDSEELLKVYSGNTPVACTASNGMEVKDLYFQLTDAYYTPPEVSYIKDNDSPLVQPDLTYRGREGAAPRSRYRLGDNYLVYTFWPDLYYKGHTTTEVVGMPSQGSHGQDIETTFETLNVGYRVKFDIKKKKALVVLYDVQFNKDMPAMKCLFLPDLDVQFTNNGYVIEAQNIIPLYIGDGEKIMEYPKFPFTSFKFSAETNMVEANCEFQVGPYFFGHFTGRYMEFSIPK